MQYRKFGTLDWKVSALGFGAMRLPLSGKNPSDIDEPKASKMVHRAIEKGVNYIDTAYIYHGGQSEIFLGKALRNGYRKKVKLATKLPPWGLKSCRDFDTILHRQLKNLQVDTIDFYLLHGLNDSHWPNLKEMGVMEWAEKAKQEGKIAHLGFSFHDHVDVFKEIIDDYDHWEFCQIQLNFMDTEFQAGLEGLEYAVQKNLGVVIMEPLRGGQLVRNLPDTVAEIWTGAPIKRSVADWALQWVWDHPGVSVVLSGMSSIEELEANLESAAHSQPGSLTQKEFELFDKVREEYKKTTPIPCTACKYCMPCEENVAIPAIFEKYNSVKRYGGLERAKLYYKKFLAGQQADRCSECYECEEICPQDVEIVNWLKTCHREFS